ncbi:MAG TPA: hypothetical protein VMF30_15100 [Pirellulales bacterium]|nr:hypothetical protein [Pirellulales bacterium]
MRSPLADIFARQPLAACNGVAVLIVALLAGVASAQSISGSQLNATQITISPLNVPPMNIQLPGGSRASSTNGQPFAVSAPIEPAEEDSEGAAGEALPAYVPRRVGSPSNGAGRPTGILQLVTATEPIDETLDSNFAASPPAELMKPNAPPAMQWNNSYETGPAEVESVAGWRRLIPTGMNPWGPRTPLADRAVGWGTPLLGTSWLNRPWSAGWFAGGIFGSPLMHGVSQQGGFYGGYRLGFDYDFYWGWEARLGAASICLSEPDRIGQPGTNDFWNLDMSLLYYPWGDSQWRPYASAGMGMATVAFWDPYNNRYDQLEFATPIGIGLKYRWTNWVVFRTDLMDNIAYARGMVETTNNFSFSAGVEMRFGGVRRSYWPWNPGRVIR